MHNQYILPMCYCHIKFQRYSFGDFFYKECDPNVCKCLCVHIVNNYLDDRIHMNTCLEYRVTRLISPQQRQQSKHKLLMHIFHQFIIVLQN